MIPNDITNARFDRMLNVWQMCRDAKTGQRAIKQGGTKYLPLVYPSQTSDAYNLYKMRALYMNATGRTVDGMVGLVFRKYPTISLPKVLEEFETDITMDGVSLAGLAQKIVEEVITVGRGGVMVDYPSNPDNRTYTIEQARVNGIRPYLTFYKAEDIRDWKFERVNNKYMLTMVKLYETDPCDVNENLIRELHLTDGVYGQRVWKSGELIFDKPLLMKGQAIREIPFYFCQPNEDTGNDIQNPPIEDLVYVNIAHYRNSADLENGVHVAGLPTPWVNGVTDPKQFPALNLGADTFISLPPDAQVGFLQCGQEGFSTIEKAMDRKQEQMAQLGARIMATEKRQSETAEAQGIKRGGETSVLQTLAASIDMSLTKALKFMARWMGVSDAEIKETYIELNKDYIPMHMTAQELTAWVAAWQSGAISYPTFFQGLQKGEMVAESTNAEEEQERIAADPPRLGTVAVEVDE